MGVVPIPVRRASIGSTPALTCFRQAAAWSRASANPTSGKLPRPISRRLPSMVKRSTHFFAPELATTRRSPPPSSYLPGPTVVTLRGRSLCIGMP